MYAGYAGSSAGLPSGIGACRPRLLAHSRPIVGDELEMGAETKGASSSNTSCATEGPLSRPLGTLWATDIGTSPVDFR
jgi:hypothetical protein